MRSRQPERPDPERSGLGVSIYRELPRFRERLPASEKGPCLMTPAGMVVRRFLGTDSATSMALAPANWIQSKPRALYLAESLNPGALSPAEMRLQLRLHETSKLTRSSMRSIEFPERLWPTRFIIPKRSAWNWRRNILALGCPFEFVMTVVESILGFSRKGKKDIGVLLSLRERAAKIGAQLTIVSRVAQGTQVRLSVSAGIAHGPRTSARPKAAQVGCFS